MTIDEAIKHCEEVAEEQDMKAGFETDYQTYTMSETERERCRECAKEHRQLSEWLRELKIHREIHDVLLQTFVDFDLDICCDELMDNEEEQKICEENCDNKTKSCWVRWARLKAREVKTDEDSD